MKRDLSLMRRLLLAAAGEAPEVTDTDSEILSGYRLWLADAGWIGPQGLTSAGDVLVRAWRDERTFLAVLRYLETQSLGYSVPLFCEAVAIYSQSALAARRIDLGLLQSQVAHRAGLVTSTICRCEREVRLPQSLVAVRSYAAALQLSEAALRELVAKPVPALQEA